MSKNYKLVLIVGYIVIGTLSYSQGNSNGFDGSIHFGSGIGTVLDFKEGNRGCMVPFEFGFQTQRELNSGNIIEIGLLGSRKGTRIFEMNVIDPGSYEENAYSIKFFSIELPIKYYWTNEILIKKDSHHFIGMNIIYLPSPPSVFTGYSVILQNSTFRDYNLSVNAGFGFYFNDNLRVNLETNIFLFPLIKSEYIQYFQEQVDYFGSTLLPVDLILSLNYFID